MSTTEIIDTDELDVVDTSVDNYLATSRDNNIRRMTVNVPKGQLFIHRSNSTNDEEPSEETEDDTDWIFDETAKMVAGLGCDILMRIFKEPKIETEIHTNNFPEDMLKPHIILHFAFNKRMSRMFIEFSFDFYMHQLLKKTGLYAKYAKMLAANINANFHDRIDHHYYCVIVRPKYRNVLYGVTPFVTISTVSYWKSITGHYEFLNDKRETDHDFDKFKMVSETIDDYYHQIELFAAEVQRINDNMDIGNYDVQTAFENYAELYKDKFGIDISCLQSGTGSIWSEDNQDVYYYINYEGLLESYEERNKKK